MKLAEGLGTAGWVIGFVAGLGGFLVLVWILIMLFIHAGNILFNENEEEEHDDADD